MHGLQQVSFVVLLICLLAEHPAHAVAASDVTPGGDMPGPPATYYGEVFAAPGFIPVSGMPVTAHIDGRACGQNLTSEEDGSIVYAVDVVGEGPGGRDGCGASERVVIFQVASQYMAPVAPWDNTAVHHLPLQPMRSPLPPIVSIDRSGEALVLSWPSVALDTGNKATLVSSYRVWRSLNPYFDPAQAGCECILIAEVATSTYVDSGDDTVDVVGDVAHNYAYLVKAVNQAGESADSNAVGEFDFMLKPAMVPR